MSITDGLSRDERQQYDSDLWLNYLCPIDNSHDPTTMEDVCSGCQLLILCYVLVKQDDTGNSLTEEARRILSGRSNPGHRFVP